MIVVRRSIGVNDCTPETLLPGGNVNSGVVRIGDTVRRGVTGASAAVHALLRHLEAQGFGGSPRFLGIDEQGREILSFVPGSTGIPPEIWAHDGPLAAAARLLREYHDATAGFTPPDGAAWAFQYPDARRHEVICHNDFAPYNFVFRETDGVPTPCAVIDFDLAGPGPRLRDVAYAAYWMTPLSCHSADQVAYAAADRAAGSRRLKLFCTTYGIAADGALLDMVQEMLDYMGDEDQVREVVGAAAAARLKAEGHLAHWQQEAEAFRLRKAEIQDNLMRS
jgi:hypothetical protein